MLLDRMLMLWFLVSLAGEVWVLWIQICIGFIFRSSVADPYHFNMDPDPGCEKICYGSRANFDTDPDPGKNDTDPDPDPAKKD